AGPQGPPADHAADGHRRDHGMEGAVGAAWWAPRRRAPLSRGGAGQRGPKRAPDVGAYPRAARAGERARRELGGCIWSPSRTRSRVLAMVARERTAAEGDFLGQIPIFGGLPDA